MISGMGGRVRHVIRRLARAPMFTIVTILTLGAGIGANSAIFSVVNGVLLRPLPYEDPDALVGVWHRAPGLGFDEVNQAPALHFTYQDEGRVFEDVGMWDNNEVSVTGLQEPERVQVLMVTYHTFPLLRIRPALGRTFNAADDSPDTPETVLLSYGYWQDKFGSDPDVLGRRLMIDGRPRSIIGVLPRNFRFLRYHPVLILPFRFDRSKLALSDFSYQGIARLKPGVTIEQANADVARMIPLSLEKFPREGGLTLKMLEQARFGPDVHPLKQDAVGEIGKTLWVLLGTGGIVLLVACANVANLFLVRAEGRQQELAIRSALGAGWRNLAGELLHESLLLGILGGVLGLALTYGGIRLLLAMGPASLPRLDEVSVDPTVLWFTAGISIFAGLLFGLFAVLRYARPQLGLALKESGRGGAEGRERHRARNSLVVAQVALALVLLVSSGLMARTFQALSRVHPGFEHPEGVLTLRIYVPASEAAGDELSVRTHEQILKKIESIPGVEFAGLSSSITMDGHDSNDPLFMEDFPVPDGQLPPIRRYKWISPNYFKTMGNPILAGRDITWNDIYGMRPVVLVTDNLAREYWSDPADAIGKRVRSSPEDTWREIVGIVGNVRDDGVGAKATPIVYWPMLLADYQGDKLYGRRTMGYAIRSSRAGTPAFLKEVREAVWSVNRNLPLANVRRLSEILADSAARTSFALVMLIIASIVALLLGAVGIYGVVSYAASRRTREIGIRMALGAEQTDVSRMFLIQSLRPAGLGLVLGLVAAGALTHLMNALLFGVSHLDPITYVSAAFALGLVVLLASYIPARRAARLNPIDALRWE